MKNNDYEDYKSRRFVVRAEMTRRKSVEYASKSDRLANFKIEGAKQNKSPMEILWVYASKHLEAIQKYINQVGQCDKILSVLPQFVSACHDCGVSVDADMLSMLIQQKYSPKIIELSLTEPIQGRIDDAIEYLDLLSALVHELNPDACIKSGDDIA